MNTLADKTQENKSQSVANAVSQKQSGGGSTFQFVDNRPEAVAQRKLQEMANNSPQVKQLKAPLEKSDNRIQAKQASQIQAMADYFSTPQQLIQKKENKSVLPINLKSGIENLSCYAMDDVNVHYNSAKPARLQVLAHSSDVVQRQVIQFAWETADARNFVDTNPPNRAETPVDWKNRVAAALGATDYNNAEAQHRLRLSAAFARYHRHNIFDEARAYAYLTANAPVAPQTQDAYVTAHQAALVADGYIAGISDDIFTAAFNNYHREHVFTQAQATAFVTAANPAPPQTFAQYSVAHAAALTAAGYIADVSENFLDHALTEWYSQNPFTQQMANAYFTDNPPAQAHATVYDYMAAHQDVLEDQYHIYAALGYEDVVGLFRPRFLEHLAALEAARAASIAQLNIYVATLPAALRTHVFNGGFNNGGPKGLHAYTGGGIGAGNTLLETIGNPAAVHIIIWTNAPGAAAGRCKWSTMFPIQYHAGQSAWHLLNHGNGALYQAGARPVAQIPAWDDGIAVQGAGDTMYPVLGGVNNTGDVQGLSQHIGDPQIIHGNPVYRFNDGNVNYVIDN